MSIRVVISGHQLTRKCFREQILVNVIINGVRTMALLEVRSPTTTRNKILVLTRLPLGDVGCQ